MECKKIQEWLMTDHRDGELNPAEGSELRQHIEGCAVCREFEESVRMTVAAPFRGLAELQPDPVVWQKIRGMIAAEEDRSQGWLRKVERFLQPVLRPLPVFRLAFVVAMVLMVVVLARWPFGRVEPVYAYMEEQAVFLGELQTGNPESSGSDATEYELPSAEMMS